MIAVRLDVYIYLNCSIGLVLIRADDDAYGGSNVATGRRAFYQGWLCGRVGYCRSSKSLDAFKWLRGDNDLANANVYNIACYSTRARVRTTPPVVHVYSRSRYNRSSAGRLLVCTRAPLKWLYCRFPEPASFTAELRSVSKL